MKRYLSTVCLLLSCVAFMVLPCRGDEMADDFAWFTKLGYHDVKGLKFVRYVSGSYGAPPSEKMKLIWSQGFVLEETPEKFRILTVDFGTIELLKNPAKNDVMKSKALVEPQDLKAYAESLLASAEKSQTGRQEVFRRAVPGFEERAAAFVLAWDCSRQGLDDTAARLYAEAQKPGAVNGGEQGWNLRRKL